VGRGFCKISPTGQNPEGWSRQNAIKRGHRTQPRPTILVKKKAWKNGSILHHRPLRKKKRRGVTCNNAKSRSRSTPGRMDFGPSRLRAQLDKRGPAWLQSKKKGPIRLPSPDRGIIGPFIVNGGLSCVKYALVSGKKSNPLMNRRNGVGGKKNPAMSRWNRKKVYVSNLIRPPKRLGNYPHRRKSRLKDNHIGMGFLI